MYNPLLCYPPLHYCWGGHAARLVYTVGGAILDCATPPPTQLLGQMMSLFFNG